jgi:hypothetical protein
VSKKKNNVGVEDSRIQGFQVTEKTLEASAPGILDPLTTFLENHRNPGPLDSSNPFLKEALESWPPGLLDPFLLLFLLFLLFPAVVSAEGISGAIEWSYSLEKVSSEPTIGNSSDTEDKTFTQRYFLNLDRTLYPNLRLAASGTFEKNKTDSDVDGVDTETTATTKSGLVNLRLDTQLISSGIGFTKREEKVETSSGSTAPHVMDTYTASLSWQPEGLPSMNAFFTRTDTYDKDRELEDTTNDRLVLNLRYEPVRSLELQGGASFSKNEDKLSDTETKITSYTGRATYTRRFWERVLVNASYNYFRQETELTTGGGGEVLLQVFPFFGLSSVNDTPSLVILDPNPAVIDGDLTASTGINIGPVSPGGDNRPRQIGLDFINPAEVNTVYVWVDRELPENVSNSFVWDIYISSDNENWTLWQTVPLAPFGDFFNRFEINFNSVSARYLKVVTNPLSSAVLPPPGVDVSSILVTEMQAFLRTAAEDVQANQTQTSHIYDLNVKVLILDRPNLSYNFYYWGSHFEPGGLSKYVITNTLNLSHRFNRVFSGSASIGREDTKDPDKSSSNTYSASLTAVPLPTLFHSIVVSGRFQDSDEGTANSHSAFLNNSAELYKGLFLNLSGGMSIATNEEDRETKTYILNSGVSIIPHPTLNLNLNYSQTDSDSTGGGTEDTSSSRKSGEIAAAYNPFTTLYIYASYGITDETDRDRANYQNYALSWSPFPDGDLQFNFSYTELISSVEETRERAVTPSLRWYLARNTTLDVSYTDRKNSSTSQETNEETYFANLRVAF